MIAGLSHLLTMRRQGLRPRSVMLSVDCPFIAPVYGRDFEDMELTVHESVANDDFRAFVGLEVMLYVVAWSQLASDTLEKLQAYAKEITILCAEYGEDVGYFWRPETGAIDFDDYPWVRDFHDARKTVCRNKQEQQARLERERVAASKVVNLGERYGRFDF